MQILDNHVKRRKKYMQIIIQNYNNNLHEHQNQTKYYHYSFNTTWKPGKNKYWGKIAPNIQEGLMGVMIKNMFNDIPNNHDTQGSEHYNPV